MAATLSRKLGVKEGTRAYWVKAPADLASLLDMPGLDVATRLAGQFDYIHAFVTSRSALDAAFPGWKRHLRRAGMLWVSWPKNGQLETDLSLAVVIKVGYDHGLVESKTISVDSTWSAIKFTFPIQGKVYRNSYGRLKP